MAIFDDPEHLENEILTPNPREYCEYEKQLQYTLESNENFIEFYISDGQLPLNLTITTDGFISGTVISPDDWDTEVSNYLIQEYAEMEDWETPFPDVPDLTVGELKALDGLHITGKNYGITGLKGYYRDFPDGGELSQINFEVTLKVLNTSTTEEEEFTKWFYIQIAPRIDPESFILAYGNAHNNLKNDDLEVISPEEYIIWRKSQGHTYPGEC